jgi:hypothetical protein
MNYSIGQQVFYHGDMANSAGRFEVTKIEITKFGIDLKLNEIDGDRQFILRPNQIKDKYDGHAGDRFVTFEAYLEYQEEYQQRIKETIARLEAKKAVK